jgi:hypothetical protein
MRNATITNGKGSPVKTSLFRSLAILMVVNSGASMIWALDQYTAAPEITFGKGDPVKWEYLTDTRFGVPRDSWRAAGIPADWPHPTHAVTVTMKSHYMAESLYGGLIYEQKPKTDYWLVIREVLKADVSENLRLLARSGGLGFLLRDTSFTYRLFAYSEYEARTLALAIVEECTGAALRTLEQTALRQKTLTTEITQTKEEIQSLGDEMERLEAELTKLTDSGHFASLDEAKKTVMQMNEQLSQLTIELAGLEEKYEEILSWRQQIMNNLQSAQGRALEQQTWTSLRIHVEQTYFDVMLERRSSRARKQSMENIRDEAWSYYRLSERLAKLPEQLKQAKARLTSQENALWEANAALASPPATMQSPAILGAVQIHEVVSTPGRLR